MQIYNALSEGVSRKYKGTGDTVNSLKIEVCNPVDPNGTPHIFVSKVIIFEGDGRRDWMSYSQMRPLP